MFVKKTDKILSEPAIYYYCNSFKKMAREKFSLEFPIRCSTSVLYNLLATSSGLSEWFCDKVNQIDNEFHFIWDGSTDVAEQVKAVADQAVAYRWEWMNPGEYFEFKILNSSITNETLLQITDFAEPDEVEGQKQLWESQIEAMRQRLGN